MVKLLLTFAAFIFAACSGTERTIAVDGVVLAPLDSVSVLEGDSAFVGRIIDIVVGAKGAVFMSDATQSRVIVVSKDGQIRQVIGRAGKGPGEFMLPGRLALVGDSALFVTDGAQSIVDKFNARTGAHINRIAMPSRSGVIRAEGNDLYVASFNADSGTALVRIDAAGRAAVEGALPPLPIKYPGLLRSSHWQVFVIADRIVYSLNDMSSSLFSWPVGARAMSSVELPRRGRRGISEADYETIARNPTMSAGYTFRRSIPRMLDRAHNGFLVAAMYDADLVGQVYQGRFFITLIDVATRRACVDIPLRILEGPPAPLALRGDTLVVVDQGLAPGGQPVTYIRRFVIRGSQCRWETLPAAREAS